MDVDEGVARSVAARTGARSTTDVQVLLDDPAVDVVAVCSPHRFHGEQVEAAAHDRVRYLDGHLRAAQQAIVAGVDLRGCFVWSFMDNFEWALGYRKRFGIVDVHYRTQRRLLKDSAHWYPEVIGRNGLGEPCCDNAQTPRVAGCPHRQHSWSGGRARRRCCQAPAAHCFVSAEG